MIEALKTRLGELADERAAVEAELAQARNDGIGATVEAVRDLITKAGYMPEEILPLLTPAPKVKVKRSRAKGDTRHFPVYGLVGNAELTYSRGKTPKWLRDEITAAGMDPDSQTDRELFREQRMFRLAP